MNLETFGRKDNGQFTPRVETPKGSTIGENVLVALVTAAAVWTGGWLVDKWKGKKKS